MIRLLYLDGLADVIQGTWSGYCTLMVLWMLSREHDQATIPWWLCGCYPGNMMRLLYLDGLADVIQGSAHGDEEAVEAHHLLHQHSVHALLVRGGVLAQRSLRVKVGWKLGQDVRSHFIHHIICRLASTWWGFGLPTAQCPWSRQFLQCVAHI